MFLCFTISFRWQIFSELKHFTQLTTCNCNINSYNTTHRSYIIINYYIKVPFAYCAIDNMHWIYPAICCETRVTVTSYITANCHPPLPLISLCLQIQLPYNNLHFVKCHLLHIPSYTTSDIKTTCRILELNQPLWFFFVQCSQS